MPRCDKCPIDVEVRRNTHCCERCTKEHPAYERTWTVCWTEHYRMINIQAKSEAEAIEEAKNRLCSKQDEGENTDTLDFYAEEE